MTFRGKNEPWARLMRSRAVLLVVSVLLVSVTVLGQSNSPITPEFFGMSVNNPPVSPWPGSLGIPFGSWRTLGIEVKWSDIEQCDGGSNPTNSCYAWSTLDSAISQAQLTGQDILYTIDATPTWASSNPTDTSCQSLAFPAGSCDPPNDIDAVPGSGLGDGTNQHYRDFLTAITAHVGPGVISYWEVWNEPNVSHSWRGTNNQLVRLAKDAYDIVKTADASALITTPPYVGNGIYQQLPGYLAAGGSLYADVVTYHGYVYTGLCPNDCPIPENEAPMVANLRKELQNAGISNVPVFDDEGSWGRYLGTETISDPDQQIAFTARYYLMHLNSNVAKFYWYSWNNVNNGHFYDPTTAAITVVGDAYQQLYDWLVGSTLVMPCISVGTQWQCHFTEPGSQVGEILWDTSSNYICSNGVCPTYNAAVPTNYTQYRDLAGNNVVISNNSVPVSSKPILAQGPIPDIGVTQTVSPVVASAGGAVTFTVSIVNNTAGPINNVTLTDNLDPALTFTSCASTPNGSCTTAGNKVSVAWATMAKGEQDTITIVASVSAQAVGTIVNTATANWTNSSSQPSDNWSTVTVVVGTPAISYKPTAMSFGNQTIQVTSAVKNVAVMNTGTGNLVINNVGLTGLNSAEFAFSTSGLPVTVAPKGQTNIGVTFTPAALGKRSATLYVYSNSSTISVGLGGFGVSPSSTALTSSPDPSSLGQNVTFTAAVTCSSTFAPTGSVTFKRQSTTLGNVALGSNGIASYATSSLPAGWQTITAVYSGDNNCGTSKGTVSQGVKLPSTVALRSSLNPSNFGQFVTFTATVTSPDGGTPQGTVTFKDGSKKLASPILNGSGQATFTSSTLSKGTHSITAVYAGNATYVGSTSSVLSQVVQ